MPLPPLPEPKNMLKRLSAFLKGACLVTFLGSILLLVNVLQMLSLIVYPVSSKLFRWLNRTFADQFWGLCVNSYEFLYGVEVEIWGDDVPNEENVILVLNHQQMADIPVLFKLGKLKGRLGDMKWFVKDSLKYIPGVGWGMQFLNCLFISRNWTDDESKIRKVFSGIVDNNVTAWIICFVEGTRIKPFKVESAQKFARERNLPVLNHVLLPRTKGFVASAKGLREHVDAVYDVTIGYVDGVPTLWQLLKGCTQKANIHVRRFPIQDLPVQDDELSDWLIERFRIKDDLLNRYYESGKFETAE